MGEGCPGGAGKYWLVGLGLRAEKERERKRERKTEVGGRMVGMNEYTRRLGNSAGGRAGGGIAALGNWKRHEGKVHVIRLFRGNQAIIGDWVFSIQT